MKVLVDESLPQRLWLHLHPHEAFTAAYQGWLGLKNGRLLTEAEAQGFQVFLTADKNVPHQQNMSRRTLGLVVLSSNLWPKIQPRLTHIAEAIEASTPGSIREVEL